MNLIDQSHPFYKPLWRRIAIVATVALWLLSELVFARDVLWVMVAGGMLALSTWSFFITWPKEPPAP